VPPRLLDVPRLDPAQAVRTRTFRLGDHEINGRTMDMDRIDASVLAGSVEVWRVTNRDGNPHSFHVHGVQFQVSAVDGGPPPPELGGWKDTVYLPPNRPIDLVIRFGDYADPHTPYMFHCHVLYHEDRGMMGQFVIVRR
jgi:FtsP/CotA-like multicopper oxidase with cupredoxin domain